MADPAVPVSLQQQPGSVTHIAGPPLTMNSASRGVVRRQRCLWCGALIVADELDRMMVQLPADGSPPEPIPSWAPGGLVRQWGDNPKVSEAVEIGDEQMLPDDCCGNLDFEVTV